MEVDTDFDPLTYGFGFANRFSGGAVVAELARQDRLSELTGLKTPRVVRQLTDLAAGAEFWGRFGLCGGMSWAALEGFAKREPPATSHSVPGPDQALFQELVARQADSMRGRRLLERCIVWQLLPDRPPWWMFWSKGPGKLTVEQEWPKLRVALDSGEPVSLVQIRARGGANPSSNHQVVAVGYQATGDGRVEVRIYDPNHPGRRPTIPLDLRSRSVGPRQSTNEPVHGFFVWSAA